MTAQTIDLAAVRAAREVIRPFLHRTPVYPSATLSRLTGCEIVLKAENLQKTGSFKPRGGINAVMTLTSEQRARGVIAVSAGNHGAGVAYGARVLQTPATVVMSATATRSKVAAIESYGAHTCLVEGHRLMEAMEEIREREGQTFIHPFDNPQVIAGQGTVGLEILEDVPDVDMVVVPVGGGGLISGVATAVKALKPSVAVVGVEPAGSTAVSQSLAAGRPLRLDHFHSIADGLNAPWSGPNSLSIIQRWVDAVVTVEDEDIRRAMLVILERTKLLVEPAGAAAVAALLSGVVPSSGGKRVVAILSGGNVDLSRVAELAQTERL